MKIVKNFWTLKIQHFRFAHFQNRLGNLNPYPWNFGNITERVFFKKSKIITCGVTVLTKEMKILCGNRVSVRLYCDVNFKWHMPICAEICRAEQKYMPFFGTVTERVLRKKHPECSGVAFVYVSVLWIFFRKSRPLMVPKMAYIFVQHCIYPHILAYAI